jgi:cytochrome b subunit of formate dehydrogenase
MGLITILSWVCFCIVAGSGVGFTEDLGNQACLECHADKSVFADTNGKQHARFIHNGGFQYSSHGTLQCVDCHTTVQALPHEPEVKAVACLACHAHVEASFVPSVHGQDGANIACTRCHGDTHLTLPVTHENSPVHKNNARQLCAECHNKDASDPHVYHSPRMSEPVDKYMNSVHGRAYQNGKLFAAGCVDCHGAHAIFPGYDARSTVHRFSVYNQCQKCHKDAVADYLKSSHGKALLNKVDDAPVCTVCHGEHEIISPRLATSPVHKSNVSNETCARCHDSARFTSRYGLPSDRVDTYLASYHGMAASKGNETVAHCVSCHGNHTILPASDPLSRIHPSRLSETCGSCHPGNDSAFAAIQIHRDGLKPSHPIVSLVRGIYQWIIPILVFAMLLHHFLVYLFYFRKKVSQCDGYRYSRGEVLQHLLIALGFVGLVITGFAKHFPASGWVEFLGRLGFQESGLNRIHLVFAILFAGIFFAHIALSLFSVNGRKKMASFLPRFADVKQAFLSFAYHSGLYSHEKDCFSVDYQTRIGYLAFVWGAVLMLLSGCVLWFPSLFLSRFPHWVIDLARTVHYFEACLAVCVFLVWHLFSAVLHPNEYPVKITCQSGREK